MPRLRRHPHLPGAEKLLHNIYSQIKNAHRMTSGRSFREWKAVIGV